MFRRSSYCYIIIYVHTHDKCSFLCGRVQEFIYLCWEIGQYYWANSKRKLQLNCIVPKIEFDTYYSGSRGCTIPRNNCQYIIIVFSILSCFVLQKLSTSLHYAATSGMKRFVEVRVMVVMFVLAGSSGRQILPLTWRNYANKATED